jgi:hypothetical protein
MARPSHGHFSRRPDHPLGNPEHGKSIPLPRQSMASPTLFRAQSIVRPAHRQNSPFSAQTVESLAHRQPRPSLFQPMAKSANAHLSPQTPSRWPIQPMARYLMDSPNYGQTNLMANPAQVKHCPCSDQPMCCAVQSMHSSDHGQSSSLPPQTMGSPVHGQNRTWPNHPSPSQSMARPALDQTSPWLCQNSR